MKFVNDSIRLPSCKPGSWNPMSTSEECHANGASATEAETVGNLGPFPLHAAVYLENSGFINPAHLDHVCECRHREVFRSKFWLIWTKTYEVWANPEVRLREHPYSGEETIEESCRG